MNWHSDRTVVEHLTRNLKATSSMLHGTTVHFTNSLGHMPPFNPGVNGYMAKDNFYSVVPGITIVAAQMGPYAPQRVEMV